MKMKFLIAVFILCIATQVWAGCVLNYDNIPPREITKSVLSKCSALSETLHKDNQTACMKACKAFYYAEEMPLCMDKEELKGRPVCRQTCRNFTESCGLPSSACQSLPHLPGLCEPGPLNGEEALFVPLTYLYPPWNDGIEGTPYPSVFCPNYNRTSCRNVTTTERFFCFNRFFGIEVPCDADHFDPVADMCGIVRLQDPGCTTKECVNQFRMEMMDGSYFWECMDSEGHLKLCGEFESGDAVAAVQFAHLLVDISQQIDQCQIQGQNDKCCQKNYQAWRHKPQTADDLAFNLF